MTRTFYPDCSVEIAAFGDTGAFECEDAEVWIEGESILVSYFDDEGIVVLEGQADADRGWRLAARSRPRRGTLRLVSSEASTNGEVPRRYEGRIEEQGESADWSLHLGAPARES